jgi:hypothetical protein
MRKGDGVIRDSLPQDLDLNEKNSHVEVVSFDDERIFAAGQKIISILLEDLQSPLESFVTLEFVKDALESSIGIKNSGVTAITKSKAEDA